MSFRVAFLSQSADLYGSNRVLLQDIEALTELGCHCRVLLPADAIFDDAHVGDLEAAGAEVRTTRLHVLRRADGPLAVRIPLRLPAGVEDAGLVVPYTMAMAHYAPVLRVRRRLSVVSVHEILDGGAGRLLGIAAGLAHGVMVNSEATAAWLRSCGVRRDLVRAYPSHPPLAADRSARAGRDGAVRVVHAARINAWKGQSLVVEAVVRARAGGAPIDLQIVGGAFAGQRSLVDRLREQIKSYEFIEYAGEVADIGPLLRDADALVIGSTKPEPFGLVALEAWAAGRLTIAPSEGGAAEAVRLVEGISYTPRDPDSLAAVLLRVAADRSLLSPPSAEASAARECSLEARTDAWRRVLGGLGPSAGVR